MLGAIIVLGGSGTMLIARDLTGHSLSLRLILGIVFLWAAGALILDELSWSRR